MLAEEFEPAEVKTDPSSRKLRATNYSDGLRSGSPERYTEILRDLLARSRAGKLAPSEQQTLTLALDMFVGEVSASLERPPDEVRAEVARVTAAA
jgi:RNA polymerase-interacting CarD/CdnL/TRCF family regulator